MFWKCDEESNVTLKCWRNFLVIIFAVPFGDTRGAITYCLGNILFSHNICNKLNNIDYNITMAPIKGYIRQQENSLFLDKGKPKDRSVFD